MATPTTQRKAAPPAVPIVAKWKTRGAVVLIGIALWLGLVFFYAWPAWQMVVYRLVIDGGILLLWLAALIGTGSVLLPLTRAMDFASDRGALRFVTMAALGFGVFSVATLGLGLLGWLNFGVAVAMLAIGIAAGIVRLFSVKWKGHPQSHWLSDRAMWGWMLLLVAPLIAIMTSGALLPPGFLWTPNEPHGYDVVEYHLQVPREWYEAGRVIPLHHNVYSFFPFNVEMHYLLAMHLRGGPWAGMYLAQLMHGTLILLAVLAACGFAARITAPALQKRVSIIVTALAMISTPWLVQLGSIAYDEGGFLLCGTLAIGFTARALGEPERRRARFVLAGIMAGLACGSKLTAVPELLVAIPVIAGIVILMSRRNPRELSPRDLAGPVLFGLVGLLAFAPWLIRTAIWSHGNPVFPELATVLGHGHFTAAQVLRWHLAHTAPPSEQSAGAHAYALGTELLWSWQFGFLLFPMALISVAVHWRQREVWFLGGMMLAVIAFWLCFTHLQSRFLVLLIPICTLLIARLAWQLGITIAAEAAIAIVLLNMQFAPKIRELAGYGAIGLEKLDATLPIGPVVPSNAVLALVGDETAFFYQRPMSLLRYRTVFDVPDGKSGNLVDGFAGPPPAHQEEFMLIDPMELERFSRTYQPLPPVPPEIASVHQRYVQRR